MVFRCFLDRINWFSQSNEILSEQTCDLIWDRCHREIVKGETRHLIVLLSTPIAYPRVVCIQATQTTYIIANYP